MVVRVNVPKTAAEEVSATDIETASVLVAVIESDALRGAVSATTEMGPIAATPAEKVIGTVRATVSAFVVFTVSETKTLPVSNVVSVLAPATVALAVIAL